MSEDKKCPCGCGTPSLKGRYVRGHKPKNGKPASASTNAKGKYLLLVPADEELCEKVWSRLDLEQKIVALNAIYEARQ